MIQDLTPEIIPWHYHSAKDCLALLGSSINGLSEIEVKKRWHEYGKNVLPKARSTSAWQILAAQFFSPLMMILLIAAGLSALLYEWLDVYVIAAAIFINTFLGFIEEYQADRSWRALSAYLPDLAKVRRAGFGQLISAGDVVPGDILLLKSGDRITADARIIEAYSLETGEASLTGESTEINKTNRVDQLNASVADRHSMVYAGTIIVAGRGTALVVATGSKTEIGRVNALVSGVSDSVSPLETKLNRLSHQLSWGILFLAVLVFVAGLMRGYEASEIFRISIALAVSAIPEGLLVAFTVILAIGLQRILRHQGLVRKLISAETLGSISVLCIDKTGTLTTGEMTVDQINLGEESIPLHYTGRVDLDELRLVLALNNGAILERDARTGQTHFTGSLTDIAIARYVEPYTQELSVNNYELISEIPFDSKIKYSARAWRFGEKILITTFGAPEALLNRLDLSDIKKQKAKKIFDGMAESGLRVILVAKTITTIGDELLDSNVADLELLGAIGLRDPVRSDVGDFILTAKSAGIRTVMITGDHPETAMTIARQVGISVDAQSMMLGSELSELTDLQLEKRVASISVFARIAPEQKLRIVEAWQRLGEVVGMTGDGVNDAPAIKVAHIGIALGSSTDVAKETADLVLLDNSFKTIVMAVKEGRVIFDNMRKTLVYLLAGSFSEIILVIGALILNLPLPILPAQILWINLITDGLPSVALAFEPAESGIMKDRPRSLAQPIMNRQMKFQIFTIGLVSDVGLFAIYFFLLGRSFAIDEIRTIIFLALGLNSLLYVFAVRKIRTNIWRSNLFENKWLIISVFIGLVLQFLPIIVPSLRELFNFTILSQWEVGIVFGISIFKLILIELTKLYGYKTKTSL